MSFVKKIPRRSISQLTILGIIVILAFFHQKSGIEKVAPIHAYCPFGALEGLGTYLASGQFLQKLYRSNFILFGIFVLLTIFFGRVFCSHFCPLGTISEWLRIVGKKLGIKKDFELPFYVDKWLRYVKYIVLVLIVYFSFRYTKLVFDPYDPFSAFTHLGNEIDELTFGYLILALILIVSLFTKAWRCRYFCPLGAFFGLLTKVSGFNLTRNKQACVGCGYCSVQCPAHLPVATTKEIKHPDCIACLRCVDACPKSSLMVRIFGKKIQKQTFSFIVVSIFFIVLGGIILTPLRKTKPASNIVDEQGKIHIEGLRGSNTLQYVLDVTKIPLSYFQQKLHLPATIDTSLKLKEIGEKYGIKNSFGNFLTTEDFRRAIDERQSKSKNTYVLDKSNN